MSSLSITASLRDIYRKVRRHPKTTFAVAMAATLGAACYAEKDSLFVSRSQPSPPPSIWEQFSDNLTEILLGVGGIGLGIAALVKRGHIKTSTRSTHRSVASSASQGRRIRQGARRGSSSSSTVTRASSSSTIVYPPYNPLIYPARSIEDRRAAALLGFGCGDALGAPVESLSAAQIKAQYPGGVVTDLSGKGYFRYKGKISSYRPGEMSDDTAGAIITTRCLSRLAQEKGLTSTRQLANHLKDENNLREFLWDNAIEMYQCTKSGIKGFPQGGPTEKSLELAVRYKQQHPQDYLQKDPRDFSMEHARATGTLYYGNGPITRCMPIALFFPEDRAFGMKLTSDLVRLTHPTEPIQGITPAADGLLNHPKAVEASAHAYYLMLSDVLSGRVQVGDKESVKRSVRRAANEVKGLNRDLAARLESICNSEDYGAVSDEVNSKAWNMPCLAAWAMMTHENMEDALMAVVAKGGDTDSHAAAVGGLFGAALGQQGLPTRWVNGLLVKNTATVPPDVRQYAIDRDDIRRGVEALNGLGHQMSSTYST